MFSLISRLRGTFKNMRVTHKEIWRRRREIKGWKRMLLACHEWADEIDHADSRRAILSMAENYKIAIENACRDLEKAASTSNGPNSWRKHRE